MGASSEDIRLAATVDLRGTGAPDPYEGRDVSVYREARVQDVPDEAFAAILGRPVSEEEVAIGPGMCIRDLNHGRSPLFLLVWAVLRGLVNRSMRRGRPDLNLLFLYNMPLHAIAKNSGGLVSREMVDALVLEIRGFWIVGLLLFIGRFFTNLARNRRVERALDDAGRAGAESGGGAPSGAPTTA